MCCKNELKKAVVMKEAGKAKEDGKGISKNYVTPLRLTLIRKCSATSLLCRSDQFSTAKFQTCAVAQRRLRCEELVIRRAKKKTIDDQRSCPTSPSLVLHFSKEQARTRQPLSILRLLYRIRQISYSPTREDITHDRAAMSSKISEL